MLEINSDDIAKFKKEVDALSSSMGKLKELSSVSVRVNLPSEKSISRIASLNSAVSSVNTRGITSLSRSLASLSSIRTLGLSNVNKDLESLSNINISPALGNLRDLGIAYNKFKENTSFSKGSSVDQNDTSKNVGSSFSSDISSVSKFLNITKKIDPEKTTQVIDALKEITNIKVDEKTARFMENASNVLSSNSKAKASGAQGRSGSWFNGRDSKTDIVSTVATALTVLGSGVFLRKQANTAKEVGDLLAISEITGLDSFKNRVGLSALGVSPTTAANQQRQMSRDLISARLFGEIDPKKLILHNLLGTNFQSSAESMIKNSLSLSPQMADFILSQLAGDEIAVASSRYRLARRGATEQQRKDVDMAIWGPVPNVDVGSYTRFLIQFEGFLARSRALFQVVLGPSIKTLESVFTTLNRSLSGIDKNSQGLRVAQNVINAFVTSFTDVISFVYLGMKKIGNFIIRNNLEGILVNVASVLGSLVAGGAILKVIGITTTLLSSLLGLRSIFSLANKVSSSLLGLTLMSVGGANKKGGGSGGSSGGGLKSLVGGSLVVTLAASTMSELHKYLTMPTEGMSKDKYSEEKINSLLKIVSGTSGAAAGIAAMTGVGLPIAALLSAISATTFGASYARENPEQTRDLLEKINESLSNISIAGQPVVQIKLEQDASGKIRQTNLNNAYRQ